MYDHFTSKSLNKRYLNSTKLLEHCVIRYVKCCKIVSLLIERIGRRDDRRLCLS